MPRGDVARLRAWVFDLDGTLTVANHDFDAIRRELGIPEGHLILEWLAQLPAARAAPLHARLQDIEADLAAQVAPQPGGRELLEALVARGHRIGILTRNSQCNAVASLRRIELLDLFAPEDILGRDEAPAKPDPGGILHLLRRWKSSPGEAAMVGDFLIDLETGRNAGVTTVHVDAASGFHWPELTDLAVRSLPELLATLGEPRTPCRTGSPQTRGKPADAWLRRRPNHRDAGRRNAGRRDASSPDAGRPDAGSPDATDRYPARDRRKGGHRP